MSHEREGEGERSAFLWRRLKMRERERVAPISKLRGGGEFEKGAGSVFVVICERACRGHASICGGCGVFEVVIKNFEFTSTTREGLLGLSRCVCVSSAQVPLYKLLSLS